MGRFLSLVIFSIVATGLILHSQMQVPWLTGWIGRLPGDLVIIKGGIVLYFPIATSVLISFVATFVLSLLFGKAK